MLTNQIRSVAQSCPTLCNPMNPSTPGLPVPHQLPEFTQTHVHWVSDAIQPSHPLSSPFPPAPNSSQHQSLFQWVNSSHEMAKECSNYCTISLISHASKVMLKILQARLQQYVNSELPDVQAGFRKGREPEIKLPTSVRSSKKQESSRKTSTSALLTTQKPLTLWITIIWKILKEMGIPDHLTCLLRTVYAGQEAVVRTGHGATD